MDHEAQRAKVEELFLDFINAAGLNVNRYRMEATDDEKTPKRDEYELWFKKIVVERVPVRFWVSINDDGTIKKGFSYRPTWFRSEHPEEHPEGSEAWDVNDKKFGSDLKQRIADGERRNGKRMRPIQDRIIEVDLED